MRLRSGTVALAIWLVCAGANAEQAPTIALGDDVVLTPSLQYRPRIVAHEGRDFRPGGRYTAFSHRARLGVEAEALGWIAAMVQLQDVRVWGAETDSLGDYAADGFDLHQGWVEVHCPENGSFLRIGRQEVAWDNERLVGAVGWSDQGRSLDAVRLGLAWSGLELELLYAMVSEGDVTETGDTQLAGFHLRHGALPWLRPALVALYDHIGQWKQNRATVGVYLNGSVIETLSYTAELYYQIGERDTVGQNQDLRAFLVAARAGYTLPVAPSPGVTAWFEYLSGDEDPTDGTLRTFDTLYATNHKFYGFIDLFTSISLHTSGLGLVDAGGRAEIKPVEDLLVFLDFHHFEQARRDPVSGSTTLGNELDLLARYRFNRYLALEGVAGLFWPKLGAALRRRDATTGAYGTDTEAYGYLQLDLTI